MSHKDSSYFVCYYSDRPSGFFIQYLLYFFLCLLALLILMLVSWLKLVFVLDDDVIAHWVIYLYVLGSYKPSVRLLR